MIIGKRQGGIPQKANGPKPVAKNPAVQHGFDRDEVIALLADMQERAETRRNVARSAGAGVKSIPHFVFNGRLAINGGRSEAELADAIRSAHTGADA